MPSSDGAKVKRRKREAAIPIRGSSLLMRQDCERANIPWG